MIRAKNCEKLSKFIEVIAKILSVPFCRTWCIKRSVKQNTNLRKIDVCFLSFEQGIFISYIIRISVVHLS